MPPRPGNGSSRLPSSLRRGRTKPGYFPSLPFPDHAAMRLIMNVAGYPRQPLRLERADAENGGIGRDSPRETGGPMRLESGQRTRVFLRFCPHVPLNQNNKDINANGFCFGGQRHYVDPPAASNCLRISSAALLPSLIAFSIPAPEYPVPAATKPGNACRSASRT